MSNTLILEWNLCGKLMGWITHQGKIQFDKPTGNKSAGP